MSKKNNSNKKSFKSVLGIHEHFFPLKRYVYDSNVKDNYMTSKVFLEQKYDQGEILQHINKNNAFGENVFQK